MIPDRQERIIFLPHRHHSHLHLLLPQALLNQLSFVSTKSYLRLIQTKEHHRAPLKLVTTKIETSNAFQPVWWCIIRSASQAGLVFYSLLYESFIFLFPSKQLCSILYNCFALSMFQCLSIIFGCAHSFLSGHPCSVNLEIIHGIFESPISFYILSFRDVCISYISVKASILCFLFALSMHNIFYIPFCAILVFILLGSPVVKDNSLSFFPFSRKL